jgi:hypothetical protein
MSFFLFDKCVSLKFSKSKKSGIHRESISALPTIVYLRLDKDMQQIEK